LPRDALRAVAHGFQLGVDLDGGIGEPQQPGHRLLAHQELQTEPVNLLLQLVHVEVAQDDGVGDLAVALPQRLDTLGERLLGQGGHLRDLGANDVNVPLQRRFQMGCCVHNSSMPLLAQQPNARASGRTACSSAARM